MALSPANTMPSKIVSPQPLAVQQIQYAATGTQTPQISLNAGPAYAVNLSERALALQGGTKAMDAGQKADATEKSNSIDKIDNGACQTCKSRKYQDGSNDTGVSFKTPGHIAPENAAAKVLSHEQEHINIAMNEARAEDKELISHSIRIYSAACPECGKSYIAGGEAKTTMRTTVKSEKTPALGENVDIAA